MDTWLVCRLIIHRTAKWPQLIGNKRFLSPERATSGYREKYLSSFFSFYSGANPNAQTTETEEMKVKAAERMQAREAAKKEARQKAVEKFQEIQTAKATEQAKEAERQKKAQKLPSPQPKAAPAVSTITSNKMNSFEADLGHSTNPFDEPDFSFSSEDGTNPFLDDIRAASAAASALSFGGNPFEETTSEGEINRLIQYFHKISDN